MLCGLLGKIFINFFWLEQARLLTAVGSFCSENKLIKTAETIKNIFSLKKCHKWLLQLLNYFW